MNSSCPSMSDSLAVPVPAAPRVDAAVYVSATVTGVEPRFASVSSEV